MIRPSIDVVCHWSSRMVDPRCPVTLRHADVAAYRAPRFGGVLTLRSLQSPRAERGRAFSATSSSHRWGGTSCACLRNILFRGVCLFGKTFGIMPHVLLLSWCFHPWTPFSVLLVLLALFTLLPFPPLGSFEQLSVHMCRLSEPGEGGSLRS